MTIRQVIDALERRTRGPYRGADQARRALEREQLERWRHTMAAMESGPAAAQAYEAYMARLFDLHREGASFIDWAGLLGMPAPRPPSATSHNFDAATAALARYEPSTFDQLTGRAKTERQALEHAVEHARVLDARLFEQIGAQYIAEKNDWQAIRDWVPRILERDPNVYTEVLLHTGVLGLLEPWGTHASVAMATREWVTLTLVVQADKAIPANEIGVSAWGNSTAKPMSTERRWQTLVRHLCSSALRIAADTLQVLPIDEAIVNVGTGALNPSTGRVDLTTLLALRCARSTMERLNLHALDPVDALVNFEHRMRLVQGSGLQPVEPIRAAAKLPQGVSGR